MPVRGANALLPTRTPATPTSSTAPSNGRVKVDAQEAERRLDVMEPVAKRPTAYEARMQRGAFAGFAELDGHAVPISKSPDGRSASFVAEAGQPLRVVLDPELVAKTATKVELAWYLASAGHTTKQRITLSDRDMRTGALVIAPGTIQIPEDASGNLRLTIETTGADGRVSSNWSPHYDAIVMPKSGATLVFDEDWSVTASSGVRAGEKLAVAYDADRLRTILGADIDSAVACVSFDGQPPLELPLTNNGQMMLPSVQVPFDATRAVVWFRGTGGGKTEYDSALGANFTFDVALPKDDADASWKRMALTIKGLPALTEANFTGIGPSDAGYNCIAWSIGSRSEWVWPGTTTAAFDALYAQHGYAPLDRIDTAALAHDATLEKIVLFGHPANGTRPFEATHAARMGEDGKWTSKLGTDPLIRHEDPRVVEGPSYGQIARVYVRARVGDT